jgi:hypothetical protein
MRRLSSLLFLLVVLGGLLSTSAGAAEWHSQQPVSGGIEVPEAFGQVGDIEFWAPNRGVLITGGNGALPSGIYAWDGVEWHLYSTQCGGSNGRIAWSGPDEFWTVSDQRAGQELGENRENSLGNRSLCHFQNGAIVASYAEPIGVQTSYLPMNAAACAGPDDCWFAGERFSAGAVNAGAFHLHWNGTSLSAVPSLTQPEPALNDPGRSVEGLTVFQGRYYESVQIQEDDSPASGESVTQPNRIHRISSSAVNPFQSLPGTVEFGGGAPSSLGAFHLSGDGSELWAVAGAAGGESSASLAALRLTAGLFAQLTLKDEGGIFAPGDEVNGLAAEPGSNHAWVAYQPSSESDLKPPARLAQIHSDGTVDSAVSLPGPSEGIGRKGAAGPVACPAVEQCWMATSEGWLFHLGSNLPRDEDPAMHVLITFRPEDNGVPSGIQDEIFGSESDSEEKEKSEEPLVFPKETPPRRKAKVVTDIHQKLIHKTVLSLSFHLHAKAHVQLLAKRHKKVVAKTPRRTMGKGKHSLRLKLDPDHWPTGLDFEVHALKVRVKKKRSTSKPGALDLVASGSDALKVPELGQATADQPATPATSGPVPAASTSVVATATAASSAPESLVGTPVVGIPVRRFLGASPLEIPGEVWATSQNLLWHYTEATGWQALSSPVNPEGAASQPSSFASGPLAGNVTPRGGVAIFRNGSGPTGPGVVVREPGVEAPRELPAPGAAMRPNERLFSGEDTLIQAIEEDSGKTGVLVAPSEVESAGVQDGILHWDGSGWSREAICAYASPVGSCEAPSSAFRVVAIAAGGGEDAWLLGTGGTSTAGIQLFHSERTIVGTVWRAVSLGPEGSAGSLFAAASSELSGIGGPLKVEVRPRTSGQPLTATSTGVWIDAELSIAGQAAPATLYFEPEKAEVTGSWCDVVAATSTGTELCATSLGAELPSGQGRSFAWSDGPGSFGTRIITGLPNGTILTFAGESFTRVPLKGGEQGGRLGAAFSAPDDGWLGGQEAAMRVTVAAQAPPTRLVSWPVPFHQPLLAIASQPGVPVGSLDSEAIAVGSEGEVARYVPGRGWIEEPLLTSGGARVKPRLRAVAWPEADFAYAVGDNGEMWLWRKSSGLWESDPGKPPNLIRGNFESMAFDPQNPDRGYAVGRQGLMLGFGKQWSQEPLPETISPESEFTSVTFAGEEAMVAFEYQQLQPEGEKVRTVGGLLVNEGTGWRVDEAAAAALEGDVPRMVAGLPDGGAVMTTLDGQLFERESAGGPWQLVPVAELLKVEALAAFRENGQIRALVAAGNSVPEERGTGSAPLEGEAAHFLEEQPGPEQPPLLRKPSTPAGQTYVLRQTATGWRDEENEATPPPEAIPSAEDYDLPRQPDPVYGLLVAPDGSGGWAVGGVTATGVETAGVMRYGEGAAPPVNAASAPIAVDQAQANFVIGGEAACAGPCADLGGTGIGPDVWLPSAVRRAAEIPGLRAFLYTGPGVAESARKILSAPAFGREEQAYAARLAAGGSSAPVFAAATESDLDPSGSTATFLSAFASAASPLGGLSSSSVTEPSPTSSGKAYYSFTSTGVSGSVRVIVLDYSASTLEPTQKCWLAEELSRARTIPNGSSEGIPAIVIGSRDLTGLSPNVASDRAEVSQLIVTGSPPSGCTLPGPPGGASAYFFDYPEQDRSLRLSAGAQSIPAFGSGTLGYVDTPLASEKDFAGASGFLLASVDVAQRNPQTNVAPVTAGLIPSISELAIDAADGTFLRRSQVALFEGLARRPRAGIRCTTQSPPSDPEGCTRRAPDPYVQIPSVCQGPKCGTAIFPEYSFSSSDAEVAQFVEPDPNSLNPRRVLLGTDHKPVPDSHSGLLCTYNAGTTTVTIDTGGLSYSTQVTVQEGSVEQPCGTVPRRGTGEAEPALTAPPPPPPGPGPPTPTTTPITHLAPPPPPVPTPTPVPVTPTAPAVHHPIPPPAQIQLPFIPGSTPIIAPAHVAVPPPPPTAAEPAPPTGTSPVTQPAVSPEPEEEEEVAFDLVHHAVAVEASSRRQGGSLAYYLPAAVILLAIGGAAAKGRRRRAPEFSYVSNSRRGGS